MRNRLTLEKGVFMISIDVELAWGFNYELLKGSKVAEKYLKIIKERSRTNVRRLLEISEHFKIPFTWAIVGHLFLYSCDRDGEDLPHPDMPRPNMDIGKDWYANDPCSNFTNDPLWYAPDIIKLLMESKVEQEIACHSFSHIDFSKCSKEVALAEIKKCKEVMKDYGIKPITFIFPKNRIGHLDLLRQEGFKTFRIKLKHADSLLTSIISETFFPRPCVPIQMDGLLGIPSNLLFQSSRKIDTLRLQIAANRGIVKAANEGKIFQISMHDYLEMNSILQALSRILSYAAKASDKGKLDIMTMYECYKKFGT